MFKKLYTFNLVHLRCICSLTPGLFHSTCCVRVIVRWYGLVCAKQAKIMSHPPPYLTVFSIYGLQSSHRFHFSKRDLVQKSGGLFRCNLGNLSHSTMLLLKSRVYADNP